MMTKNIDKTGVEVIQAFVKTLPELPGVYRMLTAAGDALYIGKAKSLRKRVHSYIQMDKLSVRMQRAIAMTAQMEFTTTHTEAEALLLEANLIKRLKPRYNILLRDDKSFPYILLTAHDFPQAVKHRGAKDTRGAYYGPFASGLAVNETIAIIQKAFMLRNCSDTVFAQRTRPCLQYHIKRCTAPCVGLVTKEQYAKQADMARDFLSGKSRKIQDYFAHEMEAASTRRDYESAALFRDRIQALTHVQSHQTVHIDKIGNVDIHAIHQEGGQSCVQVFIFRAGQNFGNRAYFPRHGQDDTPESILSAFIAQFYTSKPVPDEIIVNFDLDEADILSEALQTTLTSPKRGDKKELTVMATKNAREALERKRAMDATQAEILQRLANVFALDAPPSRIEVYDNSHISGTHALGVMIVAGPEGFQKTAYRKFNMDGRMAAPGDDVGMMKEMLTRRLQQLVRHDEGDATARPDLLLIDGGQAQLNATMQVMADLGISDIPVVAIAKGPKRNAGQERFFREGTEPTSLPPDDPVLYFLQRVRDEAHRFAITSHRTKRSRAIGQNPLDEVPGIGGKRKKALLVHFGSAKAVAEAGVSDLQKVEGVSRAMAEKIYRFFHDGK